MVLPDSIGCTIEGCMKQMYLKNGSYGEFYSHKEEGAPKGYHTVNAAQVYPNQIFTPAPQASAPVTREKVTETDWDEIARGKVRCQIAVAFIGKDPNPNMIISTAKKMEMEGWVDYVMFGLKGTASSKPSEDLTDEDLDRAGLTIAE